MADEDDQPDDLDGCDIDFTEDETPDDMIDWIALFATVEEHNRGKLLGGISEHFDAKELGKEWKELFTPPDLEDAT